MALPVLFVASLIPVSALASLPADPAGKIIANPALSVDPNACVIGGFGRYQVLYDQQIDPADTLTLEMAIIPFRAGQTNMLMADSNGGRGRARPDHPWIPSR